MLSEYHIKSVLKKSFLTDLLVSCNFLAQNRPNIVLLIADDLGYGTLGCQGNAQIPTPNIDGIASKGVRLEAGYVSAPNCNSREQVF